MTEADILALTYQDSCWVYRPQKTTLPSGESVFQKGLDGRQVYEIEFVTATMEYDYELDAESGAVRERKSERLEIQNQEQSKPSASYIGVDRAKSTALSHAGLQAGSVTFTKAKLENDDGMSVYEIEFRKGSTEYEYSIDAYKGTILEWDKETDHD